MRKAIPPWLPRALDVHAARVHARGKLPYTFEDLVYLTMGFAGECGEVANELKKAMRGDHGHVIGDSAAKSEFLEKFRAEIADARVYLELLATATEIWAGINSIDPDDTVTMKLDSFEARYKKTGER